MQPLQSDLKNKPADEKVDDLESEFVLAVKIASDSDMLGELVEAYERHLAAGKPGLMALRQAMKDLRLNQQTPSGSAGYSQKRRSRHR